MMISTIFIVILICTLYASTAINAGVIVADTENTLDATNYNSYMQHKFDALTNTLNQIDGSLKTLKEQAHTWAIFKHHIEAWNENMRVFEQKLDLVKRTQDEQQSFGNKLISLEFILNHILSKVVYLSDSCADRNNNNPSNTAAEKELTSFHRKHNGGGNRNHNVDAGKPEEEEEDMLRSIERTTNAYKKFQNDISTRLTNILRHVQNIENDKCRHHQATAAKPLVVTLDSKKANKMANIMLPVGACNASQRYNYNVEQMLQSIDSKLTPFALQFTPKDFKQLHALARKNSKNLDDILNLVTHTDKRLVEDCTLKSDGNEYCQAISGELTTFTESSDLLLKRIEWIVQDINEKLIRLDERQHAEGDKTLNEHEHESEGEGEGESEVESEIDDPEKVETIDTENEDDDKEVKLGTLVILRKHVNLLQPNRLACHELEERKNGIYKFFSPELNEAGRDFNERYCTFATEGIAWTVIQYRGPFDEQENFNRSWNDYRSGFGHLDAEFWFGNEFVHQLVYRNDYELRIELEDFEGATEWAEYSIFRLDSEIYNYNLLIGGNTGTLQDSLAYHNEMDFSTYDRRNDKSVDACCSCATGYASGWWFDNCSEANLNGIYHDTPLGHNYVGIIWESWHDDYSLRKTRMMIRPKNWTPNESEQDIYNEYSEDP